MTIDQIREVLKPHKPMSVPTLYKHLHDAGIKPVSKVRQIPQRYPSDTPQRLLKRLGITPQRLLKRLGITPQRKAVAR